MEHLYNKITKWRLKPQVFELKKKNLVQVVKWWVAYSIIKTPPEFALGLYQDHFGCSPGDLHRTEIFKCSPEELFKNTHIYHNITVVTFPLFNIFNYTLLHYGFQDLPNPPHIWQLHSICQNKLALWVVEIYFFMKAANVSVLGRSVNLIYWFVFLGFRPNRQKLLQEFSSRITSALAKYVKHTQIPPERVTNYDMYLHMFNHIYLISFCYFCGAPYFGEGVLGAGAAVHSAKFSRASILLARY